VGSNSFDRLFLGAQAGLEFGKQQVYLVEVCGRHRIQEMFFEDEVLTFAAQSNQSLYQE
jgi:hypothetical protein